MIDLCKNNQHAFHENATITRFLGDFRFIQSQNRRYQYHSPR